MKNIIRLISLCICCLATVSIAQNAPQSIAGSVVSLETTTTVPVYALNFTDISSCNLKLIYDPMVATATGVTIGQGMGGMINTNLTIPGVIILGWFTSGGISLPDNSSIFNIQFSKVNNGQSAISWMDDGYSCEYNNGSFIPLNDSPTNEYYFNGSLVFQSSDAPLTYAADIAATPGSNITIPVAVSNFQLIGSLSLNLHYDPAVLTYQSFENTSGFPGLTVNGSQPGVLQVSGFVPSGENAVCLDDYATLFNLHFAYQDGFTALTWYDNGTSCQYSGSLPLYPVLNDSPQSTYYVNGSVSANALPNAAGIISGPETVCAGSTGINYSVPVISYATAYVWAVPDGATILSGQNTNSILVAFGPDNQTGLISVFGTNSFGSGTPSMLEVSVIDLPGAAGIVSGDQEVCQGQTAVIYSVDPINNAAAYNWILPAGAGITSGANTNNISVNYDSTSIGGAVSVNGFNVCGSGNSSTPLQIIVNEIPRILAQPQNSPAIYAGTDTAVFTVQTSGTGLALQWQEYNNGWNDLYEHELYSGVNSDTLNISNPDISMNGFRYRCSIAGICEPAVVTDGNAMLSVLLPVGIPVRNNEFGLQAYPNPCSKNLNLDLNLPNKGNLKVTFTNLSGVAKEVKNINVDNEGAITLVLNTSGLTAGFYTLSLNFETANNLMMRKQKIVILH